MTRPQDFDGVLGSMSPLLSQIIRLTKSLRLHPDSSSRRPSAQFMAGKRSPFMFAGGFALSWWYSDDTFHALDAVVALIIEQSPSFRDCDPESVSEAVTQTLHEICIEPALFDVEAVVLARRETLFECHSGSVPHFATAILSEVERRLQAHIGRRCTIHALPRFQVASFNLDEESLHVVAKEDRGAWQRFVDKGYLFDGWTPEQPFLGATEDGRYAPPGDFSCLLVAEENGTQKGARFNSILRFRKVAAILFAIASQQAGRAYYKAMARPSVFCIQFPHGTNPDRDITRSDCDPIAPYYASDIPIGEEGIAAARDWYGRCSRCSPENRSRIEKGAHFLNRGMNSDDIEGYINYFVTLDALFGERGSVESTILAGVAALAIDQTYNEKASWLFDLRNELVHGGSRYIREWPKYARYTQHFRSKPMDDVRSLAQLAVLRAPYVFAS